MWVYKGVEVRYEWYEWPPITFIKIDYQLFESWGIESLVEEDWWKYGRVWINELDITSITPIPNPPKLLPVGTNVRVFEEYTELDGQIVEIEAVYEKTCCYSLDCGSFSRPCPARAVYPVWEE